MADLGQPSEIAEAKAGDIAEAKTSTLLKANMEDGIKNFGLKFTVEVKVRIDAWLYCDVVKAVRFCHVRCIYFDSLPCHILICVLTFSIDSCMSILIDSSLSIQYCVSYYAFFQWLTSFDYPAIYRL